MEVLRNSTFWGVLEDMKGQDKQEFSVLISVLLATGLSVSCNLAMVYMGMNHVDTSADSLPLPT